MQTMDRAEIPWDDELEKIAWETNAPKSPLQLSERQVVAVNRCFGQRRLDLDAVAAHADAEELAVAFRQSNVVAARYLFRLSQYPSATYRARRIQARNGSWIPVIHVDLLTTHFANLLKANILDPTVANGGNPAGVIPGGYIRPTPHENWHGDLPEAKHGEANFAHVTMHELSVVTRGGTHAFAGLTSEKDGVDDAFAIRIVIAVSAAGHQDDDHGAVSSGPKAAASYYYDSTAYTGHVRKIKGQPQTDDRHKRRLYNRPLIRIYFSFNHYRPIQWDVHSDTVSLNPWFCVSMH